MRRELFWNPQLLCERVAVASQRRRRMKRLRGTVADGLNLGHIDSLELLDLCRPLGISTIYDVGACVGTWTILAKSQFPQACVISFEPMVNHFQELVRRVKTLPGVSTHRVALGNKNGTTLLHVTDFSDASSLLTISRNSIAEFHLRETRTEVVIQRCLDEFVGEQRLPSPDLLKLDVQGYELAILQASQTILATTKAVLAEVSFIEYYQDQCLFHDVVGFLSKRGFRLAAFGVNTPTGRLLGQTDVLFLRGGNDD